MRENPSESHEKNKGFGARLKQAFRHFFDKRIENATTLPVARTKQSAVVDAEMQSMNQLFEKNAIIGAEPQGDLNLLYNDIPAEEVARFEMKDANGQYTPAALEHLRRIHDGGSYFAEEKQPQIDYLRRRKDVKGSQSQRTA